MNRTTWIEFKAAAWPASATLCVLATHLGCASLDATPNIDEATAMVTDRSGSDTGWAAPWDEQSPAWDGSAPLTSDAAVRVALQNNRAIRQQVEQIVAARSEYVQAHLLPNPMINVAIGVPTDGMGGEPFTAGLMQQLAWLWRRPAMIDAAEANLRRQVLAVSDAALQLVADVRTAHAQVLFAQQAHMTQSENVRILAESEQLLQNRFAVGESSRFDLNRAALDLRAGEVVLSDRQAKLDLARRRLLTVLGRADAGVDWVAAETESNSPDHDRRLDEDVVIALAWEHRLDVAAARASVDARAAAINLQERGRIGEVNAGASYQQNFSNRPGVFPSIQATVPVFDDNRARVAKAESEFRQAVIEADRIAQKAITEARAAWVALQAQQEVLDSYEHEILRLAESNLALARHAFEAGEADLTAMLDAQRLRNVAQIELLDRQLAAATLRIELERAVGGSLDVPAEHDEPPVAALAAPRGAAEPREAHR